MRKIRSDAGINRKPYRAYWTKWMIDFLNGPYDSYRVMDISCDDGERARNGAILLRACSKTYRYPVDVMKMGSIVRLVHLTRDSEEAINVCER